MLHRIGELPSRLAGVGPFLAIYLAQNHWDPEHVGIALTAAGIVTQTPAGWLVDSSAPSGG